VESIRKAREDTVKAQRQTFSEVGDLVSASLEKEMAFKYSEYGVNMLREIDSALEKLKGGSYGTCEDCGRIIGVKRLEVVPFARLCVRCKSKEEEGKGGSR
jgi:DnaK suppressor protein